MFINHRLKKHLDDNAPSHNTQSNSCLQEFVYHYEQTIQIGLRNKITFDYYLH